MLLKLWNLKTLPTIICKQRIALLYFTLCSRKSPGQPLVQLVYPYAVQAAQPCWPQTNPHQDSHIHMGPEKNSFNWNLSCCHYLAQRNCVFCLIVHFGSKKEIAKIRKGQKMIIDSYVFLWFKPYFWISIKKKYSFQKKISTSLLPEYFCFQFIIGRNKTIWIILRLETDIFKFGRR